MDYDLAYIISYGFGLSILGFVAYGIFSDYTKRKVIQSKEKIAQNFHDKKLNRSNLERIAEESESVEKNSWYSEY